MRHHASPSFWQRYHAQPQEVRELADKSFGLLKQNPRHPSIHFKKVGRFWSARVGVHYRALAVELDDNLVWFWIGDHTTYDQLIRRG